MSSRLGSGLWESRFILPEHKEVMRQARREEKRRQRPVFDEQYAEEISQFLVEAHRTKAPANLRMYDPFDDSRVIGVVERLDPQGRRFMVDGEWFRVTDIVAFEYASNTK